LYSISAKQMYPFKLPNSYYHICCGFSHGWLATINKSHAITILHPFKNVAPISLPTLENRPYSLSEVGYKVILSADPITRPNDYMVVASHTNIYGRFAFIKAGQSCWNYVWFSGWRHSFMDFMFYGGLVYAVSKDHGMVSFNPGRYQRITPNPIEDIAFHGSFKGYLVKSLEGDLWMVKRFFTFKGDFQVYKLEFAAETGKFKQMLKLESLGDNVLFLGDTDSISVSASYFFGCLKKDSIYYTEGINANKLDCATCGPFHIGIYNVRDGTFARHNLQNHFFNKQQPPPFWVLPNFQ
jgi:hypothetical protein